MKCYPVYDLVEWDGDNVPAVSTLTDARYGEGVEYDVELDGSLTVTVPGYPSRSVPVGGVLVLNPNLDQFADMAALSVHFGTVA